MGQPGDKKPKPLRGRSALGDLGRYAAILSWGFNTAAALVAGILGGQYLDRRWGTEPWLSLAGVILAIVVSLVSLVREIMRLEKMDRR